MTYVMSLPCVDLLDKTCIDECPVDCIYERDRMLYIHPDECVDCGASRTGRTGRDHPAVAALPRQR